MLSNKVITLILAITAANAHTIDIHIDEGNSVTGEPSLTTLPAGCYWDGTSPFCGGNCHNQFTCRVDKCGDGKCCITGNKVLCCPDRASCPSRSALAMMLGKPHMKDGDNEDICKEKEFLCCPPGASTNSDCKCIKNKYAPSLLQSKQESLAGDAPHGQLCKDEQTLCCNPGATDNEECGCIDE